MRAEDGFGLALLAGFLALPLVVAEWVAGDLAIQFSYALLAVSLGFVWGHCGLLSLGHAVFFGIGAYAMSTTTMGMLPGLEGLHSTWAGLVLAVALPALAAYVVGWFFFFAKGLHGAFFGIVTLALAFIAERAAINWPWLGGLNGLLGVPPINLGLNGEGTDVWDPLPLYYVSFVVLALVIAGLSRVARSDFGVALAAIRENELRCRALGYDASRMKVRAYTLGGAVAGLGGALFVVQFNFASPALIGFSLSAEALIWVAVGGRGSLVAAACGALVVKIAEAQLSSLLGVWWPLVIGALFMLCVLALPRGLFGELIHGLAVTVERLRPRRRPLAARER